MGFCLLAAPVPTYFIRWMNPLVLRTMYAITRVAYVPEKTIPENCAEVAQGASKKGRPKEYDRQGLPHNTKLVYNDYHHQFKLSSTSAQTEKIKINAFSHELKLTSYR